ncbi:MAG: UbiD family decarboxylase [Chloroflexi bacterium]|nr:UbiD family decarboxylase [Chloroflexota bacterium]
MPGLDADNQVASLTSFIAEYERQFPDEVVHIGKPVDSRYEVTAAVTKLERQRKFPVLVFHNVLIDGLTSPYPLVTFLFSSRVRLARAAKTLPEQLGLEIYERMQLSSKPVAVNRDQAPVKQIVRKGPEVDVRTLPAPVHHYLDPGPYLSAGFLTCYDPDTGVANSALHRGWLKGRDEIRVAISPATDNALIYSKYEARGQPMRAAYWIGHHPLAVVGCELHVPSSRSHYEVAGAVLGQPLRVVPSETLGDDFLVPADAEIVIEGIIPPGERRPEAPFGEYPRYVGPQRWHPYMRVTAMTHRADASFLDIMVGHTHWVASLGLEGKVLDTVGRAVPTTINVYLPMSGCGIFHAYVQIRNRVPGLSRMALMAALTADYRIKHAFVFDEDVDIFDEREVLLALATRFQGDRDIVVVENCVGPVLDPSGAGILGAKVGFDCTKPASPQPFAERLRVPDEVMEGVDLKDLLGEETLARIPVEHFG